MKVIKTMLMLALAIFAFACSPKEMTIKGVVKNHTGEEIRLYEFEDGDYSLFEAQEIGLDSTFEFVLPNRPSGFYFLGSKKDKENPFASIYMKKGGQANVLINNMQVDESSYPEPEQQAVYDQWGVIQQTYHPKIDIYNVDEVGQRVVDYSKASQDFIKGISTSDKDFNALMTLYSKVDFYSALLRTFSWAPKDASDIITELPCFKELYSYPLSSAEILKVHSGGTKMIKPFLWYKYRINGEDHSDYFAHTLTLLNNDTLKGQYLCDNIIKRKVLDRTYQRMMNKYDQYIVTEKQKSDIAQYEEDNLKFAEGQPWIDFTAMDIDGQVHSLSDYKGKVVLVDVWASWCSPCKAEMPHLEKLEKNYHNRKDIVFVSLSIDRDKAAWEKFVKEKAMKGILLHISGDATKKLRKDYEIPGIPRFMLFDREGKIVSINCPRPSDPQLKKMIDEQL